MAAQPAYSQPQGSYYSNPAGNSEYGMQPVVMGLAPGQQVLQMPNQLTMVTGGPGLWPNGVGFATKQGSEDSCQCCRCTGCSTDYWWSTHADRGSPRIPRQSRRWGICGCGGYVADVDVLGTRVQFDNPCNCCGEQITMRDATGHVIGVGTWDCCNCSCDKNTPQMIIKDGTGKDRFMWRDNCCMTKLWGAIMALACCDYIESNYPITDPQNNVRAQLYHRFHCCYMCYPEWIGFRGWAPGTTDEEKMLLLLTMQLYFDVVEDMRSQQNGGGH